MPLDFLIDKTEVVLADKPFSLGKEQVAPTALIDDGVGFIAEFELPTRDEDVDVEVHYFISEDGGATWRGFGGFLHKAGPWLDMHGKPSTRCGISFQFRDAKGQLVGPTKGSIIKSEVTVTKPVTGKVVMTVAK